MMMARLLTAEEEKPSTCFEKVIRIMNFCIAPKTPLVLHLFQFAESITNSSHATSTTSNGTDSSSSKVVTHPIN